MEGCRGLSDLLTGPVRELLPDRLDHLPLAREPWTDSRKLEFARMYRVKMEVYPEMYLHKSSN